jgi:hypothetical protein
MIFLSVEFKFDVQAVFDPDLHLDGLLGRLGGDGLGGHLRQTDSEK